MSTAARSLSRRPPTSLDEALGTCRRAFGVVGELVGEGSAREEAVVGEEFEPAVPLARYNGF